MSTITLVFEQFVAGHMLWLLLTGDIPTAAQVHGRGLHSFTFQLNLSHFRHKIPRNHPLTPPHTPSHPLTPPHTPSHPLTPLLNTPRQPLCAPLTTESAYVELKSGRV